jgi:hypothetical protein
MRRTNYKWCSKSMFLDLLLQRTDVLSSIRQQVLKFSGIMLQILVIRNQ